MKRVINFQEIATYNHRIEIEAKTEEILDCIEDSVTCCIDANEVDDIDFILKTISNNGGKHNLIKDGSPDVEYEIY